MKSCSSSASTSSTVENCSIKDEDKDSGICSLYCLASCLGSSTNLSIENELENAELASLLAGSTKLMPFLRKSIFSNVPPTIIFYTKGHKVKKPTTKSLNRLTWCHNSLLPVVIRQSLSASHFKIVDEAINWIGYWGRHLKTSQYHDIKPYQKVNHFPGAFHIGRKDRLWQHLAEMMSRFEKDNFSIMPYTYVLPKDSKRLKAYLSMPVTRHVILKPPASARGTGISIVSQFKNIPTKTSLVAQHYIESPLIINGAKFDLRVYVYVTSLDPLRIYIYDEGLVRFASVPYSSAHSTYSNQFMHLTNYSINKLAQENGDQPVPKWTLTDFWIYLTKQGYDAKKLKNDIKEIALKAIISCESFIRKHQEEHSEFPFISHELFGMDVLVDSDLKPWLIEMNISPSLHSSTSVDIRVKAPLAKDVLNMCGIQFPLRQNDYNISMNYRVKNYSRHKSFAHLEKEKEICEYFDQNQKAPTTILSELTDADVRCLIEFEDEITRCGSFELIYPLGEASQQYLGYLNETVYSNILLNEWQKFQFLNGRSIGNEILEKFCVEGFHIIGTKILQQQQQQNETDEDIIIISSSSSGSSISAAAAESSIDKSSQ